MVRRVVLLGGAGVALAASVLLGRPAPGQEAPAALAEVRSVEARVQRALPATVAATVLVRAVTVAGDGITIRGMGSGSGVCISPDGEILTCAHVVELPGATLSVRCSDGREFPVRVVGADSRHDFALLRVDLPEVPPLPYASLGRSADLAAGDWVVALGHPLRANRDNQPTVSVGIFKQRIAGLQAPAPTGSRVYPGALQHDAPLFSGNSGGPLFDLAGRVIGINAAITLEDEHGYAVPADRIAEALPSLRRTARADVRAGTAPPVVGLRTIPVDDQAARVAGVEPGVGELVLAVAPGSAAARAGLEPRDLILAVDGSPLRAGTLAERLARAGVAVRLRILRGFRPQELELRQGGDGR